MDADKREELMSELFAQRTELEKRAAELERQMKGLDPTRDEAKRGRLQAQAQGLRADAERLGRRWSELQDEDIHDDDRGGIER